MSDQKQNIDKLFRDGVQQHYPVNEALWADVSKSLPAKNNKGLFVDLILVLLCLAGLLNYAFKTDNTIAQNIPETSEVTSHKEPAIASSNKADESIASNSTQIVNADEDLQSEISLAQPQTQSQTGTDFSPTNVAPSQEESNEEIDALEDDYTLPADELPIIGLRDYPGWELNWKQPEFSVERNKLRLSRKKTITSLGVELSYGFAGWKTLNGLAAETQELRSKSEHFNYAFSKRLIYEIGMKNWFVDIGLGRTDLHENLKYQFQYEVNSLEYIKGPLKILNDNYDLDGQTVTLLGREIIDSTIVSTPVTSKMESTSHYRYISVPIRLGYRHNVGVWTFGSWMRPEMNRLITSNLNYVELANGFPVERGELPAQKWVYLMGFGVDASYRFHPKFVARMSISGVKMLSNTHQQYEQRFTWLASGLSVHYNF